MAQAMPVAPSRLVREGCHSLGAGDLLASVEAERQGLEEARRQLEAEKKAWEEERSRMQTVLSDSESVVLNVGGIKYTTSLTTLRNAPSPSLFNGASLPL